MRILVATLGSYGDVYPFAALASVLKERGHEVVLLTHDFFRPLAERQGLAGPVVYFDTLILPGLRAAYERLREGIRAGETVIVASTAMSSARLVQEELGVPTVTVHLAPAAFKSAHESPQFGRLPRAAAVVHHGGIGCVSQALGAGVPQLIRPMAYDQHDNAARLRRLGVGDGLAPDRYRADAVADRLQKLLDSPGVAERCGELAGRLARARPLADAAALIEAMLGR